MCSTPVRERISRFKMYKLLGQLGSRQESAEKKKLLENLRKETILSWDEFSYCVVNKLNGEVN